MPNYWRWRPSSASAAFSMCREDYQETTWDAFRIEMLYGRRRRPPSGRSPQRRDILRRDAAQSRRFALPQTDSQIAGIGEVRPGSVHFLRCSTQVRCAASPPPPIKSHMDRSEAVITSAGRYNTLSPGRSRLRRDPSLTATTNSSPHHRAVQQSTELKKCALRLYAPRANSTKANTVVRQGLSSRTSKGETKKGRSVRTSKGLVTREDHAAHDRGRTFEGWKGGRIWAPFTKGETKQGHSARTSKGLVTREDRAVHERGRTFGRHSPRVKPSKGAVRERQKGLVTREDRTAHERGRTFGEWY